MSAKPIRTALDDLLASPGWSIEERPEIPGARIRHDSGLYLDLPPDLFTGKRPDLAGPLAAALRAVERGITGATRVAFDLARSSLGRGCATDSGGIRGPRAWALGRAGPRGRPGTAARPRVLWRPLTHNETPDSCPDPRG